MQVVMLAALFVSAALTVDALSPEVEAKIKSASEKCRNENNIDEATYKKAMEDREIPNTKDAKCMVACFAKEMGHYQNGNFVLEAMQQAHKMLWDDASIVAKADAIIKECIEGAHEDDDCEHAYSVVTCSMAKAKEAGIPHPK